MEKILINHDLRKRNTERVAQEIINLAIKTANEGGTSFIYDFGSREKRHQLNNIHSLVEKLSNGQVVCGYRSDYWIYAKYFIIEEK